MKNSQEVTVTNGVSVPKSKNDGSRARGPSEPKSRSPLSDSVDSSEREGSGRPLSTRSQEPLPAVPLAENPTLNEQASAEDEGEHEYEYARVPQAEQMQESESEGEGGEEDREKSPTGQGVPPPLADPTKIPYGKVTKPPSQDGPAARRPDSAEDENYSEVREISRYHPRVKAARGRSATDPLDPTTTQQPRSHRTFTDASATHLPLPAIPSLEVNDKMYDSIPEDSRKRSSAESSPSQPCAKRDRLYEAVDDMEDDEPEDTYETVPDDIKPDPPPLLSSVPLPSPTRHHSPSSTAPAPPASPIPRKHDRDEKKKKELSKTVSDSEARKSRTFSLFTRKKTASISAGAGKSKSDHEQQTPLLQASGPRHPPSIPPPAPPVEDEEDDMYETPDKPPHLESVRLLSDSDVSPSLRRHEMEMAKAKSSSLPLSMRAGPGFFNPKAPLPELPEDSGSGAVAVGFPPNSPGAAVESPNDEPNYDSLTPQKDDDEDDPYDTVKQEDRIQILGEKEEPGYDKVRGKEGVQGALGSPLAEEGQEGDATTVAGYGKVTTPGEPKDEKTGAAPEHDDLGYAVVPQEFRMRKRTLSASAKPRTEKDKDPGYSSIKEVIEAAQQEEEPGYDSIKSVETEMQSGITAEDVERQRSPASPEGENYAVFDYKAKRAARQKRTATEGGESLELGGDELQSVTPPPPVPAPAADLGVDMTEFEQPPVPLQSERALQLVSDGDDPDDPYAKILSVPESSADPPYARVDLKDDPPYAKVAKKAEPPYASVSKMLAQDQVDDEGAGYDTVDVVQLPKGAQSVARDKALGYDTVGGDCCDVTPSKESKLEQDTPKLDTVEITQPMYDRLEPETPQELQPTYDSLEPSEAEGGDHLRVPSPEQGLSQDSYEEIDEGARLKFLEKYLQNRSQ